MRKSIFRNKQWEVTCCGLASIRGAAPCCYHIDAELLLATASYGGTRLYDWPIYVVEKPWVKPALFFEAFEAAIEAHEGQYEGEVDRELLEASFEEAWRRAEQATPTRSKPAMRERRDWLNP